MTEVTISQAVEEEQVAVDDFVKEHFRPDMPLMMPFGLQNSSPPRPPTGPTNPRNFTLLARDNQGHIVGLAINKVNPTIKLDADTPTDSRKMLELLQYIEEQAELDKLPEHTVELRVLSVRRDWRQRGVARRLTEESTSVARDKGFQAIRVCCVSEFTANLARSLGWREHYRLAYQDYPLRREVNLQPTPPHEHIYYYVKDL